MNRCSGVVQYPTSKLCKVSHISWYVYEDGSKILLLYQCQLWVHLYDTTCQITYTSVVSTVLLDDRFVGWLGWLGWRNVCSSAPCNLPYYRAVHV